MTSVVKDVRADLRGRISCIELGANEMGPPMRVTYESMTLEDETARFIEPVPASSTRAIDRRESFHSVPDGSAETGVSSVVTELARLGDLQCVPRIMRDLRDAATPTQPEALVASLLGADITLETILEKSPLKEDDTLRFLARLVTTGFIALSPASRLEGDRRSIGVDRRRSC